MGARVGTSMYTRVRHMPSLLHNTHSECKTVAYAKTFQSNKKTESRYETNWTHLRGKCVHIVYLDHLLFKNVKESRDLVPVIRETIGWLVEDCDGYIKLLWDRSVKKLPQERSQNRISGMIILKPLILGIKEVNLE